MARYSPITRRERVPDLAPLPRVLVGLLAVLFAWVGGRIAWGSVRGYLAWREFARTPRIEVVVSSGEGEIERAIGESEETDRPLELAYREKGAEAELRGRFHRFGRSARAGGSPLTPVRARQNTWLGPDLDESDWLAEIRSHAPMQVSRIGTDLVSRVDRPDARGELAGLGMFGVPFLIAAPLLAIVAIRGSPIRAARSPVLFVYAFHAVILLPLTFAAVLGLGMSAAIAKGFRVENDGLFPELAALGIYGLLLLLLVPWSGYFVRFGVKPQPGVE